MRSGPGRWSAAASNLHPGMRTQPSPRPARRPPPWPPERSRPPALAATRFVDSAQAFHRPCSTSGDRRQDRAPAGRLPPTARVGPRSERPLDIVGAPGARVQSLRIDPLAGGHRARARSCRPLGGNALVLAQRSRRIVFRGDTFTAKRTELQGRRCGSTTRAASLVRNSTLLALRRPHAEMVDVPAPAVGGARHGRAELVPRLPRLRLHRRPGGAEPR